MGWLKNLNEMKREKQKNISLKNYQMSQENPLL